MGSFNAGCALSNIDIAYGEDIVMFLLGQTVKDPRLEQDDDSKYFNEVETPTFAGAYFECLSTYFITGKYDDYGYILPDESQDNQDTFEAWTKLLNRECTNEIKEKLCKLSHHNKIYKTDMFGKILSVKPMFIRKDVFDRILYRFDYNKERTIAYFDNVKQEIIDFYGGKSDVEMLHHMFRKPVEVIPIGKELCERKYGDSFLPEELTFRNTEHTSSGTSGLKGTSGLQIMKLFLELVKNKSSDDFIRLMCQTTQTDIIANFIQSTNKTWMPHSYAGQENKKDILASVLRDFAAIAQKCLDEDKEEYYEEDYEMNRNLKPHGFTKD